MNETPATPELVLYAEDDENDAFLIRHCWKRAGIAPRLEIVPDGQRAIEYLRGTGEFADRARHPAPRLLLLDLNLPRVGGMEVLRWVRAQPDYARLPTVILSSSNQKKDIDNAQALGADRYFVKPSNVTDLALLVETLRDTWLR
jgi:CheY-like chemotaxis protein